MSHLTFCYHTFIDVIMPRCHPILCSSYFTVLQVVALPPVAKEVMLLLAEYREVTTCYRFTNAERRLSARVSVSYRSFTLNSA